MVAGAGLAASERAKRGRARHGSRPRPRCERVKGHQSGVIGGVGVNSARRARSGASRRRRPIAGRATLVDATVLRSASIGVVAGREFGVEPVDGCLMGL